MRKTLFYLGNVGLTLGFLLAVWLTNGFQQFAAWHGKPVLPFLWGIVVVMLTLALLILANHRFSVSLEARNTWEIWGRGSTCGLMIGVVWAGLYLADLLLKEFELSYRIYLVGLGLAAAIGLGLLAVICEGFLRKNLVAIGWVLVLGGSGFLTGAHRLIAHSVVVAGFLLILTVTLATGRLTIHRRYGGQMELTRDQHSFGFWFYVVVLIALLVLVICSTVRIVLGYPKF